MKILNLRHSILALTLVFCGLSMQAQERKQCGSTEAQKELLAKHPELRISIDNLDNYLNEIIANTKKTRGADTDNMKLIIPIVFHVIHNYGSENISDEQIKDAVRILNVDYQKRNADTSLIVAQFKPLIAKVQLEFRLATIDPDGNCTDGIDRIASYKTYRGNDESKLNPWPRNRYFNVWTMHTLQNTQAAAYAYKPATAQSLPYYDGVLAWHSYIGSIGTSSPNSDGTLTHEIGHCLNLDHPWGGTNSAGDKCGDDNVSDTPPTEGHNLDCSLTTVLYDTNCKGTAPGEVDRFGPLENVQNFMDYSYCANEMFTIGQKERMRSALRSSVAQRSELFTNTTHTLAGILDGQVSDCNPIADFNAARRFACIGTAASSNTTVIVKDFSHKNTINSREWTFNNASPATSTTANPSLTYATKGWQSVTLKASTSATKFGTLTKTDYIYISDPADKNLQNEATSFENPNDYTRWPIFNYFENAYTWKFYDQGNVPSGWRALMFDGFDSRTYPQNLTLTPFMDIDDIISPSYDATGLSTGFLSFKLAASTTAGNSTQIDDSLIIQYSTNCGNSWNTLSSITGNSLINNGSYSTPFYPTPNTIWSTISVPMVPPTSSAPAFTNNTYFRFRHRGGTYSNNLFIDDFMIGKYPVSVSVNENNKFGFVLVPNPAQDNASVVINTNSAEKVTIVVTDMIGKVVFNQEISTNANQSNSFQLPSHLFNTKGIYMVTVSDNKTKGSQKLVIQ